MLPVLEEGTTESLVEAGAAEEALALAMAEEETWPVEATLDLLPEGKAGAEPLGKAGAEPLGKAGKEPLGKAGAEPLGKAGADQLGQAECVPLPCGWCGCLCHPSSSRRE